MHDHASLNRAYRVVFNEALGAAVAVPESARAGGGRGAAAVAGTSSLPLAPLALAIALALGTSASWALDPATLPKDGVVAAGQASMATDGSKLTVTQTSPRAIVNWSSFDVGSGAAVQFVQPSAAAATLNRVTGGGPRSQVFGSVEATGNVYLVNPAGILFGNTAQVNVGGLVASSLGIRDDDFLAGRDVFAGTGAGSVINEGRIAIHSGGRAVLLGSTVRNTGSISAAGGQVALAAGGRATLAIGANGHLQVALDAADVSTLVANGGMIEADGGQVILTAKGANALAASVVSNTGTVQARTVAGSAGRILLLADMDHGTAKVAGTLDASAPAGGDGGFVETSAAHVQIAAGARVTTKAPAGRTGSWLIDPTNFTIGPGGGGQTISSIGADTLSLALTGTDVQINTSAGGSEAGNIYVNAPVSWDANRLTLSAHGDIEINAIMTAGGSAALSLSYGGTNGSSAVTPTAGTSIKAARSGMNFSGRVDFTGSSNTLNINGHAYTIIRSLGAEGSTTDTDLQGIVGNTPSHYALGANIDASATAGWNAGAGFNPIAVNGVLEGLGHTISGLTIERPGQSSVGLLGSIGASGEVRNLALAGGSVHGMSSVGGLAGSNAGVVRNVATSVQVQADTDSAGGLAGSAMGRIFDSFASGNVSGANTVGGLVGTVYRSSVSGSSASGNVTGTGNVGGLVGSVIDSVLADSHAGGAVTNSGGDTTGGLVGLALTTDPAYITTITDSYATGAVTTRQYGGGLVAMAINDVRIRRTYATGSVSGLAYVGGLLGTAFNGPISIESSYASGNVTGTDAGFTAAGGLVGFLQAGSLNNVYATGHVTGVNSTGGLVGLNNGATIANAYATGQVTGTSWGIAGLVGSGTASMVSNSYWDTTSSGQATSAGGGTGKTSAEMRQLATFAGWDVDDAGGTGRVWRIYEGHTNPLLRDFLTPVSLQPAYDGSGTPLAHIAAAAAPADASKLFLDTGRLTLSGGSAGNYEATLSGLYSNQQGYDISYSPRTIVTPGSAAGDIRLDNPITWTNGTLVLDTTGTIAGNAAIAGGAGSVFELRNGNWVQNAGPLPAFGVHDFRLAGGTFLRATGAGTTASPYLLSDVYGLQGIRTLPAGHFALAQDVAAAGTADWNDGAGFNPIGGGIAPAFSGTLDGQGFAVRDLVIDRPTEDNVGLFGSTAGSSTIEGVSVLGGSIQGRNTVGALAGSSTGAIIDSHASADVTGAANVGGLAGIVYRGSVSGSSASGNVTGSGNVGGLVGSLYDSSLTASHASGAATNSGDYTGGLVGLAMVLDPAYTTSITDSYATGAVTGRQYGGGLVGMTISDVGIARSYATGSVAGTAYLGGLVGTNFSAPMSIESSYASGDVTGTDVGFTAVGGLVGFLTDGSTLQDVYATGDATGVNAVGGLVGFAGASNIANAYSTGRVTGTSFGVGGLVGLSNNPSLVTNSYWDVTTSGQAASAAGTGKTSAEMRQRATFAAWDIDDAGGTGKAWRIYEGNTNPLLRNFLTGVTVTANALATETYDGAAVTGTAGYGVSDPAATLQGSLGYATTGANAGSYSHGAGTLTLSGLYSHQQGYDIAYADAALTIAPKALGIAGVAAQDKIYDGNANATVDFTGLSGVVGSDDVSLVLGAASFTDRHAAQDKAVTVAGSSLAGTAAANYTIADPTGLTADITPKAITGAITAADKEYNRSTAASTTGVLTGVVGGDTVSFSTGGDFRDWNAGTGKTVDVSGTISGTHAGNYTLSTNATTTADITPKAITGAITAADKTYNRTTDAITSGVLTGVIVGDTVDFDTTGAFRDWNVGVGKTVDVGGSIGGADGGNYTLSSTNATTTADITPKDITGAITAADKTYNRTTAAVTSGVLTGVIAGDTVDFNTTGAFRDWNAGVGKTVDVGGSIGGTDGGNYTLSSTNATTTADITPKDITGTITAANKVYDRSVAAGTSGVLTGVIAGDTVDLSTSGNFRDRNAGSGKTVDVAGSIAGADSGNYTLVANAIAIADITPKLATGAVTAASKVYDGTLAASTSGTLAGIVAGDDVTLASSGAFTDKNAGSGKTVVVGSALAGADRGNYTLAANGATTADITPAPLLVTANDGSLLTNGLPFSGGNGVRYDGFVAGEDASVMGGTLLWGGTAQGAVQPGSYSLSAAGLAAANYRISYRDGLLTILAASNQPAAGQVERQARVNLEQAGEEAPAEVPLRLAPGFIKVD